LEKKQLLPPKYHRARLALSFDSDERTRRRSETEEEEVQTGRTERCMKGETDRQKDKASGRIVKNEVIKRRQRKREIHLYSYYIIV